MLGIRTNKSYDQSITILESFHLRDYFKAITDGARTARRKPVPKPALRTQEKIGVTTHTAFYVGDSENDMETAKRAGISSLLVTYGYAHGDVMSMGADKIIDDFALILKTII